MWLLVQGLPIHEQHFYAISQQNLVLQNMNANHNGNEKHRMFKSVAKD